MMAVEATPTPAAVKPKAGKALLRRLPMEERFGMAQFSHSVTSAMVLMVDLAPIKLLG
jgi:hypothetical protein